MIVFTARETHVLAHTIVCLLSLACFNTLRTRHKCSKTHTHIHARAWSSCVMDCMLKGDEFREMQSNECIYSRDHTILYLSLQLCLRVCVFRSKNMLMAVTFLHTFASIVFERYARLMWTCVCTHFHSEHTTIGLGFFSFIVQLWEEMGGDSAWVEYETQLHAHMPCSNPNEMERASMIDWVAAATLFNSIKSL